MSHAGGLLGPPLVALALVDVDALPPGVGGPQPPQQDGLHDDHDGVNRDGADWGTFRNPCLDLFLADGSTPPQRLRDLLAASWEHDAELTLKLICHLRDVGNSGKGDREGFYTAALWLLQAHPNTLTVNLPVFAKLGYIKDFPELLYRLVKGSNVRELERAKGKAWWSSAKAKEAEAAPSLTLSAGRHRKRSRTDDGDGDGDGPAPPPPPRASSSPLRLPSQPLDVDEAEAEEIQVQKVGTSTSKRLSKVAADVAQALSMYKNDKSYKHLFDSVADFFADRLKSDREMLSPDKKSKIGLAAKWCPSLDSSFDRATLLCEGIASRLFAWDEASDQVTNRRNAYQALRRLRREVLVPLRSALQLPEVYVSSQRWSETPYHRVAKKAMQRYKKQFIRHDEERFQAFMEQRDAHRATNPPYKPINFGDQSMVEDAYRILPHNIISKFTHGGRSVYHLFPWRALVRHLKSKGLFRNCVAVCDLSKTMRGTKRHVCLALGLLLAEVGGDEDSPWDKSVRPFGMRPNFYRITKTDFDEKVAELEALQPQCDDKINLRAVFRSTMNGALSTGMRPDMMTRTIFVITDKEFDRAIANPWRKDYKAMCELFTTKGFGSVVPQVVFWNLGGRRSAALTKTRDGAMSLSGFSDDLFRLFLKNGGIVTPEDEMHASVAVDAYTNPIVMD